MKKFLIATLLVFVLSTTCVFAEDWTLSLTAGYDHQSCNDDAANAPGMTFAARTKFNSALDIYADFSVHAFGKFEWVKDGGSKVNLKDNRFGFKTHLGFLYLVDLKSAENLDLGIGLGAALARSTASNEKSGNVKEISGFTNLGLSVMTVARYKLSDSFALQGEFNPDFYFVNWKTTRSGHTTTINDDSKMGFGLSAKIGFAYLWSTNKTK